MKYTGQFKDINDKLYKVEIINDKQGNDITLTFSGTPFTTSIENDDILFKPCKYSSATIGLLTKDYLYDLYSSKAQENKITFTDDKGNIVWVGYVTPNLYSQSYEYDLEELELECIDALSTLQYYDYTPIDNGRKQILAIKDLLCYCLNKCNAYKAFYFSGIYTTGDKLDDYLLSHTYISEQNFFDEEDKPMTFQQVLEEVCKFFNVTAVAIGENVYFINYDAIKSGYNRFYAYQLASSYLYDDANKSDVQKITAESYTENGGKLSLGEVYNKVTVVDSLYGYDSIIPDIFKEEDLIPYKEDNLPIMGSSYVNGKNYRFFFKYYKNNNCRTSYYTKGGIKVDNPSRVDYATTQNYVGATICKHKSFISTADTFGQVDLNNYILLHQHNVPSGSEGPREYIAFNPTVKPAFVPYQAKIVINGTMRIYDQENQMFLIEGYGRQDDTYYGDTSLKLQCKLKVGDRYWDGSKWVADDRTFAIYMRNGQSTAHYIGIDFPLNKTIDYTVGIDANEGYVVPYPSDKGNVLTDVPEFTIYTTPNPNSNYRIDSVWLSNLNVRLLLPTFKEGSDTDTKYENVINDDFVNKLPDINLKICTWDEKQLNYSTIAHKKDGKFNFLVLIYNRANRQTRKAEEHIIESLVTQYSTPSIILNINLKNNIFPYSLFTSDIFPEKKFVVDTITTDYRLASSNVKLIEKK